MAPGSVALRSLPGTPAGVDVAAETHRFTEVPMVNVTISALSRELVF